MLKETKPLQHNAGLTSPARNERQHDGENAANNNTGEGLLCIAPATESFPIKKNPN